MQHPGIFHHLSDHRRFLLRKMQSFRNFFHRRIPSQLCQQFFINTTVILQSVSEFLSHTGSSCLAKHFLFHIKPDPAVTERREAAVFLPVVLCPPPQANTALLAQIQKQNTPSCIGTRQFHHTAQGQLCQFSP